MQDAFPFVTHNLKYFWHLPSQNTPHLKLKLSNTIRSKETLLIRIVFFQNAYFLCKYDGDEKQFP